MLSPERDSTSDLIHDPLMRCGATGDNSPRAPAWASIKDDATAVPGSRPSSAAAFAVKPPAQGMPGERTSRPGIIDWPVWNMAWNMKVWNRSPVIWKSVLPARWWYIEYKKVASSFRMFERLWLGDCMTSPVGWIPWWCRCSHRWSFLLPFTPIYL